MRRNSISKHTRRNSTSKPKQGSTPVSQMPLYTSPITLSLKNMQLTYQNGRWTGSTEESPELLEYLEQLKEDNEAHQRDIQDLQTQIEILLDCASIRMCDLEREKEKLNNKTNKTRNVR